MNGFGKSDTAAHALASQETSSHVPIASIVIPAYNEETGIGRTVESVLRSVDISGVLAELIVADNASSDGTKRILGTFGERVRVIDVARKGVSHARQAGLVASKTDYAVITTDADTVVPTHWLEKHLEALDSPHVVVACGGIEYDRVHPLYSVLIAIRAAMRVAVAPLRNKKSRKLLSVYGMNMSFLKDPAMKVGGYVPGVNYGEDSTLAKKLLQFGDIARISSNQAKVLASGRRFQSPLSTLRRAGQNIAATSRKLVTGTTTANSFDDIR